ncbi:MAG: hypothetical protein H7Y13_11850 [Sphingobacteriaceae bacterium]|nr:hypothetical protein [Sphingobacteriaceae bacterium]
MTTKEAFEELISQRAWYKDLGLSEKAASSLKTNFKEGKVSTDKMEEVLEKSGFYSVVVEKHWTKTRFTGLGPMYYIIDGNYVDVITEEIIGDEVNGFYEDK